MRWPKRKARFPQEMLDEAAAHPSGWVFEIDPRFDRDEAIPAYAIERAWEVDHEGKPTGVSEASPGYGIRVPLSSVEQIQADARACAGGETLEVFVGDSLTIKGQPVAFDVGVAIAVDAVLGLGYTPVPERWMVEVEGGRRYSFRRFE